MERNPLPDSVGIWRIATRLVAAHGEAAMAVTHDRIMGLRRALAEPERIALWLAVDDAVHRWARLRPGMNDVVH
jgi:hypothetical protein